MKLLRNIKDYILSYKYSRDDFFLVSFPKTGRSWLTYMLHNLDDYFLKMRSTHDLSEIIIENGFRQDPNLMFSNKNRFKFRRSKVIFLVRDPRDVVVSWAYHSNISINDSIDFLTNKHSTCPWQNKSNLSLLPKNIRPRIYVSSWDEHVLSWTNNDLGVPKLILKYEDLVYKKEEVVKFIVNFFEKNFSIKFKMINKTDALQF